MSITGGIKFFKRSKTLTEDDVTAVASSGVGAEDYAMDVNEFTYWRSVGSSDVVTETFEISIPESVTIDRIFLLDHNFKEFNVKYDLSGAWTAFTNVVGINGSLSGITETTCDDSTSYYEFDAVTTDKLLISTTTTQVADAEKYLNQIIATEELGTLDGYPKIRKVRHTRASKVKKMLSGRRMIQKSIESLDFDLDFKNYPAGNTADIDLMFDLFDREEDFLVWLCGGRFGTDYFKYTARGWRLRDVIPMQIDKDIKIEYTKNVYTNPIKFKVSFVEHV